MKGSGICPIFNQGALRAILLHKGVQQMNSFRNQSTKDTDCPAGRVAAL